MAYRTRTINKTVETFGGTIIYDADNQTIKIVYAEGVFTGERNCINNKIYSEALSVGEKLLTLQEAKDLLGGDFFKNAVNKLENLAELAYPAEGFSK